MSIADAIGNITSREIESQPASWGQAVQSAATAGFPGSGSRVAVVGCGTSFHVGHALATLMERYQGGTWDAFPASEFPAGRSYDSVLAISRSGTTTEVMRVLESVRGLSATFVVSAVPGSPLVQAADQALVMEFADEVSVVQTRFPTSVLALARTYVGEDLSASIDAAERAVKADLPVGCGFDHWVFLGSSWTVGLAHEAALKLREMCLASSESYPAMEYRHGPISLAGSGTVVWALGDVGSDLLAEIRATGATVVSEGNDPLVELLLIQRTAICLAKSKGLDPDRPAHLVRSVVLS